jgi:hypothetical protein
MSQFCSLPANLNPDKFIHIKNIGMLLCRFGCKGCSFPILPFQDFYLLPGRIHYIVISLQAVKACNLIRESRRTRGKMIRIPIEKLNRLHLHQIYTYLRSKFKSDESLDVLFQSRIMYDITVVALCCDDMSKSHPTHYITCIGELVCLKVNYKRDLVRMSKKW